MDDLSLALLVLVVWGVLFAICYWLATEAEVAESRKRINGQYDRAFQMMEESLERMRNRRRKP